MWSRVVAKCGVGVGAVTNIKVLRYLALSTKIAVKPKPHHLQRRFWYQNDRKKIPENIDPYYETLGLT